MTRLSGAAAEARLAEAWEMVLSHDPATQQIIHVLALPAECPAWLTGFSPFDAWMKSGGRATDEVWQHFTETAIAWPYVRNARQAAAAGLSNVRILILEGARWECAPPWLRYLAEVHLPAIAALAGEVLYRVWLEDCRSSGLPDRDYDVNLWGAAGVMLAGYRNGDVDWRVFLADDHDPDRSAAEHDFIIAMHEFAAAHGQLIKLPSAAQLGLPALRPPAAPSQLALPVAACRPQASNRAYPRPSASVRARWHDRHSRCRSPAAYLFTSRAPVGPRCHCARVRPRMELSVFKLTPGRAQGAAFCPVYPCNMPFHVRRDSGEIVYVWFFRGDHPGKTKHMSET